jgi:hypothetical protein
MAKDIGSYFLEQGEPILTPKPKPKEYTIAKEKSQTEEVLDILNTKAASTMLSPRTYVNLIGQTARKAYDQQDISASDYYDIVMPLFGEKGEMVTEKIKQYDAELDRYADGGRVNFKKGTQLTSSVKKQTLYNKLLKELPEGYLEDYKKIFLNDRGDGTFSRKPGDQGGIEIMEKKHGDTIKKIKTRQGNVKNIPRKIGEFNSAILQSLQKKNKIVSGLKDAKEVRKKDLKLVGTFSPDAPKGMTTHHFMPLAGIEGESLNLSSTKNTAFIPKQLNAKMSPYDKKLKANQKEQIKLLQEKPPGYEKRIEELNYKAKNIYKEAGNKVPGSKGYLGYSQINIQPNGSYDIKVTGIDPNKSIAGLKGEEIFYKDINKGDNRVKLKNIIEQTGDKAGSFSKYGKFAKAIARPVFRAAAPFIPFVGTAGMVMGGADVAKASEFTKKPDELAAAYLLGPEGAKGLASLKNKVRGKSDEFEEFVP